MRFFAGGGAVARALCARPLHAGLRAVPHSRRRSVAPPGRRNLSARRRTGDSRGLWSHPIERGEAPTLRAGAVIAARRRLFALALSSPSPKSISAQAATPLAWAPASSGARLGACWPWRRGRGRRRALLMLVAVAVMTSISRSATAPMNRRPCRREQFDVLRAELQRHDHRLAQAATGRRRRARTGATASSWRRSTFIGPTRRSCMGSITTLATIRSG